MDKSIDKKSFARKALEKGEGIFRLAPVWVPRSFCRPGRRLKLHPADYYIHGLKRGGIDERWFASTTFADNGPGTPEDEGLSYIVCDGDKLLLRDAVDILKDEIIGSELWGKYGRWPMYSKFFDNLGPLPHHVHHRHEHAARVGMSGKPEMYFYPSQVNNHGGEFPFTFFGLNPETTKAQVREALAGFTAGDNNILSLAMAYKLELDTGWDVPAGVLHAPGSLCTYEPQFASDVFSMWQSVLYGGHCVGEELLWKNCPDEELGNLDYLLEVIDWDVNADPNFHKNRYMTPVPRFKVDEAKGGGCVEEWICYKCPEAGAKRLTVQPGKTVCVTDSVAYGIICLQGYGKFGVWNLETPTLIRYGQLTNDEFFVTKGAANAGVEITNASSDEELVILQHFAENPDIKI